jgi:hypothetical protein
MSRWLRASLGGVVLVAIEENRFRMEQQGLRAATSRRSSAGARVAEALNRKRDLSRSA